MKKGLIIFLLFICAVISAYSQKIHSKSLGLPAYKSESKQLLDTITVMDSLLFDAYNKCKIEVFASLISDDVEFYHDRGGLNTSKKELVEAIEKNICYKVNRELLKGSIEVYGIPGYGAVEMGAHRFHNLTENSISHFSKFVQIWHREKDGWKLSRVISLH